MEDKIRDYSEQDILANIWNEVKDIPLSNWHQFPVSGNNLYYFSCSVGKFLKCVLTTFSPDLGKTIILALCKDDHYREEYPRNGIIFKKEFDTRDDGANDFVIKFKDLERYWRQEKEGERLRDVQRYLGKR